MVVSAVRAPAPITVGRRSAAQHALIYLFVAVPMVALVAAVPLAWGWGVGWHDLGLLVVFYVLAVLGVTVGLHRHFTHQSFKARPWLRVIMAIAGSLAAGAELAILDLPSKSVDFLWCKPFVRPGGWGCDSPRPRSPCWA